MYDQEGRELIRFDVNHTAIDNTQEDTLQFPYTDAQNYLLRSFRYVRTDGAGATVTPRIGETATWTDADKDEVVLFGATAVATVINEVFNQPIPFRSNATGALYLRVDFDAGADNDGDAVLWFERVEGTVVAV